MARTSSDAMRGLPVPAMVVLYLVPIVGANLLLAAFGPLADLPVGFACIGLNMLLRDRLHEAWAGRGLPLRMGALILSGSALAAIFNVDALRIGLASFCAFAIAGTADALVYHSLRSRSAMVRMNGSNVVSALLDSLVFLTLAFGAWMPGVVALAWANKVVGGLFWSFVLRRWAPGPAVQG